MVNKGKEKIEEAASPAKPGRKLSPERRQEIIEEVRRRDKILADALKGKSTASILDQPALNDVNDVVAAAKEAFGAEAGLRWLGTPVPALEYATPISLVETEAGRQKIHDALVNLAHGAW